MSNLSKILVVEDSPILLLDLCDQLEELGYAPIAATTAATAARLIDDSITAMITDIELGDGPDGLALAHVAAKARPGLPIVVVSGGVTPAPGDLPTGAIFVPKPYTLEAILAALHNQQMAVAA